MNAVPLSHPGPAYELAHCVVCGHAEAEVVADADAVRAEIETLWEYHGKRLRPDTPPRWLTDRIAFSEHPPFRLVRCVDCGLIYRSPVERPRELDEIYRRATPADEVLQSLHATQRQVLRTQARLVREALGRGGSGLEVGSYVGAFLGAAGDEGLQFEGLDVNARLNEFTRSLGFTVHDGELSTFATDRSFDAVAIWNTFDQLADPRGAVNAARKLLRPNGILALRVPNGAFYAAIRPALSSRNPVQRAAACAFLAQNNLLTFPYRWGFTPRALAQLLGAVGFADIRMRSDVLVPTADRWTRPWARAEGTLIKSALAAVAKLRTSWAPWVEVYARRVG